MSTVYRVQIYIVYRSSLCCHSEQADEGGRGEESTSHHCFPESQFEGRFFASGYAQNDSVS